MLVVVSMVAGCSAWRVPAVRFANAPIVWEVDDRRPIPKPREKLVAMARYRADYRYIQPALRVLSVPEKTKGANINALGEVPSSTWFTNRIGLRSLSPQQVRAGPGDHAGPALPLRIREAKAGGARPGFLVEDARGDTFLLKFDDPAHPELLTGAAVVTQRLLWAVGYHVPEDDIVMFRRDQLVLGRGATHKSGGHEVPLSDADVDARLAQTTRVDGLYRGHVSKYLRGEPVGPFEPMGRRRDDVNDRVAHEDRRDLRGQYIFFAWLMHTDLHGGNRLDTWIEHPTTPGRGHVVHHLIDFDMAMGVMNIMVDDPWNGYQYNFDYGYIAASAFVYGVWKRPWEGVGVPDVPAVGLFDAEHFDPAKFRSRDYYMPFLAMTDHDAFWAAKILMRLTSAHIRAAVDAARYSQPETVRYLVDTLIERQRKLGRYWLSRITPVDRFAVDAVGSKARVCATDVLVAHRFETNGARRYVSRAFDYDGRARSPSSRVEPDAHGRFCVGPFELPRSHDGYLMVGLGPPRGDETTEPVWVHLARAPKTGAPRIIGVWRQ